MTHPIDGPVHTWFSLTYSNYLVLPRTLMQSMPLEWQERLTGCLDEMRTAFEHIEQAEGYVVHAATTCEVGELDDEELAERGITEDWYGGRTPPEGLDGDDLLEWQAEHETDGPVYHGADGTEVDPGQQVFLHIPDPVPPYNRGRTYIKPRTPGVV